MNKVLERLAADRDKVNDQIDNVLAAIEADDREPSEAERELIARSKGELEKLEPQISELIDLEEQRGKSRDVSAVLQRAGARGGAPAVPGAEAVTPDAVYRDFGAYARDVLIARYDQIASRVGPGARDEAQQRIARAVVHTLSGDVAGLIPTQHIAQIMQVINKNRPLVQASRKLSLQSGKISYPFISSRPTVSKQLTEKTETTSTKMQVTMAEATADTFLGAGNLSWQSINWSTPDALGLWFDLAAESYAQATEVETGATLTALTVPGSPVAVSANTSEAWTAAIAAAAGVVYNNSKRSANGVATDPATFYQIAPLASNVRTVFMAEGAVNLASQSGTIAGMTLFASPGLPAGTVIVGDFSALITAETPGAPVELRAVEPAIGGMEVGVIGAFIAQVIEGGAFCEVTPPVGGVAASARSSKS